MKGRRIERDAVVRAIEAQVECAGSLRALARRWGISAGHLSRVVRFEKLPGDAVLKHLGLRMVITYEPDVEAR